MTATALPPLSQELRRSLTRVDKHMRSSGEYNGPKRDIVIDGRVIPQELTETQILGMALELMPPERREQALAARICSEWGLGEMETAKRLGITWKALDTLRRELFDARLRALHREGWTDQDIAAEIGVPTPAYLRHTHEPACHRGMSGEPEAQCQCAQIRRTGEHQEDDGDGEYSSGREW